MLTRAIKGGEKSLLDIKLASKLDAGAATAATVTVTAVTGFRYAAHKVYWSYTGDPTGGKITITGGIANFELDITKSGPGCITLDPYVCLPATNLVATLASGAGAVVGKVNISYTLELAG